MNHNYLYQQYLLSRDLIFDLDNTLINEKAYIFSSYEEIKEIIKKKNNIDIKDFLQKEFLVYGRSLIYQKLIKKFKLNDFSLEEFKRTLYLNRNINSLETLSWFKEFIYCINQPFNLNIITNGNIVQQENKIRLLKLPPLVKIENVIYANNYKKKPNPESFFELKKIKKLKNPIFIGDSEVDRKFAENANIEFFKIGQKKA